MEILDNLNGILETINAVGVGIEAVGTGVEAVGTGVETVGQMQFAMAEIPGTAAATADSVSGFNVVVTGAFNPGLVSGIALLDSCLAAVLLLNAALLASPLLPASAGFAALAGIVALYTASVNDAYGLTLSFGGMLGGAVLTALAVLGNAVIMLCNIATDNTVIVWNLIADFVNFFASVWSDPVGSVVRLFAGAFDAVLSIVGTVADAIGSLFGQDWSSGIESFRAQMNDAVSITYGAGVEAVPKLNKEALRLDYIDYGEAFDAGYFLGEGSLELPDFSGGYLNYSGAVSSAVLPEYSGAGSGTFSEVSSHTSRISDTVSRTEEDLRYLRDIAEQEVINRFTTAEIKIDWNNTQNISSEIDLDGVTEYFEMGLLEAAERVARAVH